jgi:hypothetical protein
MGFGFSKHDTLLLSMVGPGFQLFFVVLATVGSTYINNSRTCFMTFNLVVSMAGSIMGRRIGVSNKYGRLLGVALSISCAANFPLVMAMTTSNVGGYTKKTTVSALVSYLVSRTPFLSSEATLISGETLDLYCVLRRQYHRPAAVL